MMTVKRITRILWTLLLLGGSGVCTAAGSKDIVLMLDNSGSMIKNDPEFLSRVAVDKFLSQLSGDVHVGIVVFDQKVRVPVRLTPLDDSTRPSFRQSLEILDFKGQFTNIPAALERSIYELKTNGRAQAEKSIVFMTDGIVDTGNPEMDVEKARWMRDDLAADAAEAGIRIFGIAFTDNADFLLIQSVTRKTRGEYFRALEAVDIDGVFARVVAVLDISVGPAAAPVLPENAAPATGVAIEPEPQAPALAPALPEPALQPAEAPAPEPAEAPALPAIEAGDAAPTLPELPGAPELPPLEETEPAGEAASLPTLPSAEEAPAPTELPAIEEPEPAPPVSEPQPEETTAEPPPPAESPAAPAPAAPITAAAPAPAAPSALPVSTTLLVAVAVVLLVLVLSVVAILMRRGKTAAKGAGEMMPKAFLNDLAGITEKPSYELNDKLTIVGRLKGTDTEAANYVVIDETTIGRRHAMIEYKDHSFWVIDQNSLNGTFVNSKRIDSEARLKHGDRLKFHNHEFEFLVLDMFETDRTMISDTMFADLAAEAAQDDDATVQKGGGDSTTDPG